jgi:hypothetical protein
LPDQVAIELHVAVHLLFLPSFLAEPDMLTLGAPLSREVGDGFLPCSGNSSQDIFSRLGFGESSFHEVGLIRA